jgi:2'-5' RNA ligase
MATVPSTAVVAGNASVGEPKPEQTGIMVALVLSEDQARDMVLDPEEFPGALPVDDLHITLAFLGETSKVEDPAQYMIDLLGVVQAVAHDHNAVEGEVSGVGRFTIKDGDAFYVSYDAPGLGTLRADLVERLADAGIPIRTEHDFDPHITLAYLDAEERTPVERVTIKRLAFSHLTVAFGENRTDVPLAKKDDLTQQPGIEEQQMSDTTAPDTPLQAKGKGGFVPFQKGGKKGETPGIARGAYVSVGNQKGRVDLVVTSGKVPGVEQDIEGSKDAPAIRVVIYEQSDGGWKATGRKIGAKAKSAKTTFPLKSPKSGGGAKGKKDLVAMLADHEAEVEAKDLPRASIPSGRAVAEVFERGERSWPGETKTVLTAEEWAAGRVQMFLAVAAGDIDPHEAKYLRDLDLLPEGHPHRVER